MKLTAADVTELNELYALIRKVDHDIGVSIEKPRYLRGWLVRLTDSDDYTITARADTLGDAVDAAMKAWKEGRG